MRKSLVGLLILSLFLSIGGAIAQQEGNQTNATQQSNFTELNISEVQKNIELILDKANYLANEQVEGIVRITIFNQVESNKLIRLKFGNQTYDKTLNELLISANITFTTSPAVLEATNPSNTKRLPLETGVPAMIAIKMPRGIEKADSISLGVAGEGTNSLMNPYIDVGNDGTIDWYYLGDFQSWKTEYVKSADLKETSEEQAIITDNKTYYCELINVPRTKDIRLFAKYKKLATKGNARAAIFSPVGGDPTLIEGQGATCDLQEQITLQYASCEIHLDYAAQGALQACVYSAEEDEGKNLYQVSTDALEPTTSAFNCKPFGGAGGICTPRENGDYYIKAQTANYTNNLDSAINFNAWNTFPNSVATAIENYVGTETTEGTCQEQICTVPWVIQGEGAGELTLQDLSVAYRSQGSSNVAATIYDVKQPNPKVATVEENDLSTTPVTLEFPLSIFGELKTTTPTFIFIAQTIEAAFNQETAYASLRVYKDKIPQTPTERKVEATSKAISNALSNADMSKMLKLLQLDAKLTEAKSKLEEYSASLAEAGDKASLNKEVEDYITGLPSSIKLRKSLADKFAAEPKDITSDIKSNMESNELYTYQFKADTISRIKTYDIEYNSGDKKTVLLISKTIIPKTPLKKITVYETIPKSAAQSADSIKFEQTPKIVNPDPVVSWYFPELKETQISYAIETNADLNIYDLKTIIAPTEAEEKKEEEAPKAVCGDKVCDPELEDENSCPADCKKANWSQIVLAATGLLIALLYAIAFLNTGNFRKAALGGMPFKKNEQLASLESYIAGMKSKGVADSKIVAALKQSKWTDRQIKFAYKAAEVDRQLDAKLKQLPAKQKSGKPMKEYMLAALQRGWDIKMTTNYLLKAGWQKGEISSAFLSARIAMPFALGLSKIGIKIK